MEFILQNFIFLKTPFTFFKNIIIPQKQLNVFLLFFVILGGQNAFSQSIFTNSITGNDPSSSNPYITAQVLDPNITVSGIGYGNGLTNNAGINRYNLKDWPTSGLSATDYIEFVLTPINTFKINFASFVFTGAISAGGPASLVLRSSRDGFAADITTLNAAGQTVNLSAATFQNITTAITFRIYGYGATAASGTFSINNFTFNGTVIPTTPVTPNITSTLTANNIINIPSKVYQITANNFPSSYNATNLPPGLSVNTVTGLITGTPTSAASSPYNVTVSATNAAGTGSATLVYTIPLQTCAVTGNGGWNFDANTASPSTTITNLTISNITRNNNRSSLSILETTVASAGYTGVSGFYNAGVGTFDDALNTATSTYFEFTLTPDANFTSKLTAIEFGCRSTTTGPTNYSIRSSLNSYGSDIATEGVSNNSTWTLKTPSLTSTTSLLGTPITYRIYGFGGSGSTAGAIKNWRLDDIKLTVDVTRTPPTIFAITNNGTSYCAGGAGIAVGLANSQTGVNYQLILNGITNVGTTVAGTSATISFGNQTAAGTYSVNASYTNTTCISAMSNPFSISINTANAWSGAVSTAWENTANWTCGVVPNTATAQINIHSEPANQPVLNSNVLISGILNLENTGSTLSLNGNTLTLNSTVIGNGSLIGSATSNLIIDNDAGAAFTLNINQTGNNNQLNNYTQNRNAAITLNNLLLINGIVNNASTTGVLASGSGAGNLTLRSTAGTTSGIAPLNTGANVSGNVNVESYFTGGNLNNRGTRMIAFPVQDNQASPKFIFEQIKGQMFFTGPGNTSNGFDLGGAAAPNAISMVTQNETKLQTEYGFNLTTTLLTRTIPATAYFLFYRGDRITNIGLKLNSPFVAPESVTQNYNGPINKGNINIGVTHTANTGDLYNGICAIGNPYPAVIDFDAFYSDNSSRVENILSIIKPDRTGQITKVGSVSTNNNFNAVIGSAAQDIRYIQPCQSFYVRVLAGRSGSVTFNETQKATQIITPPRLLSKPENNNLITGTLSSKKQLASPQPAQKVLRIAINNGIINNETAVIFKEGSQAIYQNEDAILLTSPILNCATLTSDSVAMAINLMPKITEPTTINILVNSETTHNNLKLNFSNLADFSDYSLILKDNYLNTLTPINTTNATYNFGIDRTLTTSFGKKRLELLINPKTTLPLNFITFTAELTNATAKLKWQVSTTKTIAYFEILKATDGVNFSTIGKQLINNPNNLFYTFVDDKLDTKNYYQIKQVNTDGTSENSEIRVICTQIDDAMFIIFPNPALNVLNLKCPANTQTPLQISVFSVDGKKLKTFIRNEKNLVQLNIANMVNGVYFLQVNNQNLNQILFKGKFIKKDEFSE